MDKIKQQIRVLFSRSRKVVLTLASTAIFSLVSLYIYIDVYTPNITQIRELKIPRSVPVFDVDDRKIGEFYKERRYWLPYNEIPQLIIWAFVAAEDAKFFRHHGFDMRAIRRAFWINLRNRRFVQGGSTITQQMAKNLLYRDKTIFRKLKEALLTYRLERVFDKNQIIELYLNTIYLGRGLYGIKAAATGYFNKDINQLNLGEISFITALAKAPSFYSANINHPAFLERREYVILRLYGEHFITKEEMLAPEIHNVKVFKPQKGKFNPLIGQPLLQALKEEFRHVKEFSIEDAENLQIFTSLDLSEMQRIRQKFTTIAKESKLSDYRHSLMVINTKNSTIQAFNVFPESTYRTFRLNRRLLWLLLQDYIKIVHLLQNQSEIIGGFFPTFPTRLPFVKKILTFEKLTKFLTNNVQQMLPSEDVFTNEKQFNEFLSETYNWNYGPSTLGITLQVLTKFAELFLALENKRSLHPHLISHVRAISKTQEPNYSFQIPLFNQINCETEYLKHLREFFNFKTVPYLSKLPGNYTDFVSNLYIVAPLLDTSTSFIIFQFRSRLFLMISTPLKWVKQESSLPNTPIEYPVLAFQLQFLKGLIATR